MLVLSRMCGQQIVIDGNITVEVMEIRGNKVRLGVVAPNNVSVHRKEVQNKINQQEKEKADKELEELFGREKV